MTDIDAPPEQIQEVLKHLARCTRCNKPHIRLPRRGWKWSVRGEPVCSSLCAVRLLLYPGQLMRNEQHFEGGLDGNSERETHDEGSV